MAVPAEFKDNPLKWTTMDPVLAKDYILNMPLEERKAFMKTLSKKALTSLNQRKAYLEREAEKKAEKKYLDDIEKVSDKRKVQAAIDEATEKIFIDADKADLIKPFKEFVKKRTKRKIAIKLLVSKIMKDIERIDFGHLAALDRKPKDKNLLRLSTRTILNQEKTPTTAISRSGVDYEAIIESHQANIRHGALNVITSEEMNLLNRPINQKEAAVDFIQNRPDLKGELSIDEYIDDSVKMNKLIAGEINVDALEMEMMLEDELKRSGVFKPKNKQQQRDTLKRLINEAHRLDMLKSATDKTSGKKVWQRNIQARGDLTKSDYERQQTFKPTPAPRSKITPIPSAATTGLLTSVANEKSNITSTKKVRKTTGYGGTRAFIKDPDTHSDDIGLFPPIHHLGPGIVELEPF